jgi:D-alanine-D-alanine ligase
MAMYSEALQALKVVVLAGGESAERTVSMASGQAVNDALAAVGHEIRLFDLANTAPEEIAWADFDACFIALHGGAGEDGRVQEQLESLGVCYTGSNPAASRLAMSKSAAKERFVAAGLPTAEYVVLECDDASAGLKLLPNRLTGSQRRPLDLGCPTGKPSNFGPNTDLTSAGAVGYRLNDATASTGDFPIVIKPDRQGSSLGVGFAADSAELPTRVAEALRFDSRVLAEKWIDGREFTVAVLGRRPLPLIEIITPRGIFDYQAKYESALTQYRFDHGLTRQCAERITEVAVAAVEALGCAGLTRVDLMLDTHGQPWLLEVNTVPGLTGHSLAPKAAAQAGLKMPDLCCWMLQDALATEVIR